MNTTSAQTVSLLPYITGFILVATVIGISLYFALKKPKTGMLQQPRKTFWLLLEMIAFAFALILAFALPWMRLSSPSSFLDSLTSYSGKQYISLVPGLPKLCDKLELPVAVPAIVLSLMSASIFVFVSYIVMCFAKREQKQPKGIILSVMIGVSALLFEAYRLFLNTGMDSSDLGGIYSFTTTGASLLVIALAAAAVFFGYMNAKKRNEPIFATVKNISKKYCSACGKPIAESASFCEHCGADVNSGELLQNVDGNETNTRI